MMQPQEVEQLESLDSQQRKARAARLLRLSGSLCQDALEEFVAQPLEFGIVRQGDHQPHGEHPILVRKLTPGTDPSLDTGIRGSLQSARNVTNPFPFRLKTTLDHG